MPTNATDQPERRRFWTLAEPHLATGRLVEGTMMGHECLRSAVTQGFVATVTRRSGDIVLKLPRARVTELVDAGHGEAFAPAGRVFSEWVALPHVDDETFLSLLEESIAFVDGDAS